MQPLTIMRATAWLGVVATGWSLNLRWGTAPGLPGGPPSQWERLVVGAALLALAAALSLTLSGRKGTPPSWIARGIAGAGAIGAVALAFVLHGRGDELVTSSAAVFSGPGWRWMLTGTLLVLASAAATMFLRPAAAGPGASPARAKRQR